jgi:Ni,Fe-hydrogenase I cytochrome b subunit
MSKEANRTPKTIVRSTRHHASQVLELRCLSRNQRPMMIGTRMRREGAHSRAVALTACGTDPEDKIMNTPIASKLAVFAFVLVMNGLIITGLVYLFDIQ